MSQKIIIVGGGFCGTMTLYHLIRQENIPNLAIEFYDRHGQHGRGVAYSTPYEEHFLNVPAGGMSALPDDPMNFVNWLGKGADPARFYPRMTYGAYLSHFLEETLASAGKHGHTIRLIDSEFPADSASDESALYVFATGTSEPRWPGKALANDPRLMDHPYGAAMSAPCKNIVILGTGLSAVDAILTLRRQNYGGQILCLSRSGLWPVSHGPKTQFWHWRKHIDSLRPHSNRIWRALPDALRGFCLRHITFWNVIRHRMPPECAKLIGQMKKSGQIKTRRGAVCAIAPYPDRIEIALEDGTTVTGDTVINCLGFIDRHKKPASSLRLSENAWTLGPPLFGHLIETTAVPELKVQALEVALDIARALKQGARSEKTENHSS